MLIRKWLTSVSHVDVEVNINESLKKYDKFYKANLVGCSCPCCERCWLYVDGDKAGSCFYGGPYAGYKQL